MMMEKKLKAMANAAINREKLYQVRRKKVADAIALRAKGGNGFRKIKAETYIVANYRISDVD